MDDLQGQVAIVTGASVGIGRGIARAFVKAGAAVVIAARDAGRLEVAATEFRDSGADVLAVPTDVSDEKQVANLFKQTIERHGQLDLLVNNAGLGRNAPIHEGEIADWDLVIATNLRGPYLCTREAMRLMIPRNRGRIINVASIASLRPRPGTAAYCASKFGLRGLTQVTALEGRPHGISCSCLNPGNVMTERRQARKGDLDSEPMMTVDEVGQVALMMAIQPPHMNVLETTVLPVGQMFVGRG